MTEIAKLNGELFTHMQQIIEQARTQAYRSVNTILVQRNWLLGKVINEQVLHGEKTTYGLQMMQELSQALTAAYGAGFTKTNLYSYAKFNSYFSVAEEDVIFYTLCGNILLDPRRKETP